MSASEAAATEAFWEVLFIERGNSEDQEIEGTRSGAVQGGYEKSRGESSRIDPSALRAALQGSPRPLRSSGYEQPRLKFRTEFIDDGPGRPIVAVGKTTDRRSGNDAH